jgi:phosphinothricin acetyltransferase
MIKEQLLDFSIATYEDLPAIVKIYNSAIPGRSATADTEPVSVQDKEKWFNEHSPEFRPLWVLKHNNEVCAWLSFQSFYGRPAYNATCEVSLYVAEDFRGQRLGGYMLNKAINECPKLGIKTLVGFIFSHNEPSLRLVYSFGFDAWGHLPKVAELDGIERDLTIVGKRIF